MSEPSFPKEIRHLHITDLERIERFRKAGYGGCVSDALASLNVLNTVFSDRFKPLRQGMQLVGRALPVKLHSQVDLTEFPELREKQQKMWDAEGGHPQKRMMRAVATSAPGSVLCFDCGGDMQPAHFGEMSCQLAHAHGCRGMLLAGNCRDTHYVLKMPDFPMFSFGTRPNAFGGWVVIEVDVPIYLPGHVSHYVKMTSSSATTTVSSSSRRTWWTKSCCASRPRTPRRTRSGSSWRQACRSTRCIGFSVCSRHPSIFMPGSP
jgi:4-hydroxy-4-methyl-2-oxoglutarate aldolase